MTTYLIAVLAGVLTSLSPCVLPVLPIVLWGALDRHGAGPLMLAAGMSAAYTVVGVTLSSLGVAFDAGAGIVRDIAAVALIFFGAALWSQVLQQRIQGAVSVFTTGAKRRLENFSVPGLAGEFVLGAILGTIWIPCAGPTLGATVALASGSDTLWQAALLMLLFSAGATLPLLLLAYGSRQALRANRTWMARVAQVVRPVLGGVLVLLGVFILLGIDKALEAYLVDLTPQWLVELTTKF